MDLKSGASLAIYKRPFWSSTSGTHICASVIMEILYAAEWCSNNIQYGFHQQLQPNSASGSGALEHDPSCVFMRCPEVCKSSKVS